MSAKDLIIKMLAQDPKKRLSAKQCLEHPWFQEVAHDNEAGAG